MVPAAVDVTTILFPLTTLLPLTILFLMFFLLPLRALPQPVATSNLPPILFQLDSSESALGHSKSAEQCIFIARQGGSEKQLPSQHNRCVFTCFSPTLASGGSL
ncbi:hypothetical protein I4F81_000643 [Pyropia yezoensis]|uniref:Uncharacterized protein n=1 Tax=Pyropia yezoensis TaxID=2788 RepID=A0ACC3BJ95_PYRYE|nr:hypothetical protein I4F81_000643 [Neopyropia yezoensis]